MPGKPSDRNKLHLVKVIISSKWKNLIFMDQVNLEAIKAYEMNALWEPLFYDAVEKADETN